MYADSARVDPEDPELPEETGERRWGVIALITLLAFVLLFSTWVFEALSWLIRLP